MIVNPIAKVAIGFVVLTRPKVFRMNLIEKATNNPAWFRCGACADTAKVEALGKLLEPGGSDDQRWNAAIALLSSNPEWHESRQRHSEIVFTLRLLTAC